MIKVVNPEAPYLDDFVDDLPSQFKQSSESIHKARNELKIVEHNGQKYVLKSFKVPPFINKLIYTFLRSSKAERSYENSLRLQTFTPKPIAYTEYRDKGLLSHSYFLSEHFAYDFTIREPLLDSEFEDRENIFKAFARFTLSLHDKGFFHKDYSPGNILIKKVATNQYHFVIVDVNRLLIKPATETLRARGFEKLWASDADLTVMAQEYVAQGSVGSNFPKLVVDFSNRNKNFKNFKKRLKGKPVND